MQRRTFVAGTAAFAALNAVRLRAAGDGGKSVIALFGATARSGREIIR